MIDLINGSYEEKAKYYYAIGMELGKAVVKEGNTLRRHHRRFMLNLGKEYYTPQVKLEKLLDILLEAEISAPKLCDLFDADDKAKNQAVWCILNASMRPIEDPKFDGLISLKDASIMFCKSESALKQGISRGKFKEGIDCKKYGKQWVFKLEALEREYGELK